MKVGQNLDGWIKEVRLCDAPVEEAQKYLKLGASNKGFDKNGKDVIDRVLEAIKKVFCKIELNKLNHTFMNIKHK